MKRISTSSFAQRVLNQAPEMSRINHPPPISFGFAVMYRAACNGDYRYVGNASFPSLPALGQIVSVSGFLCCVDSFDHDGCLFVTLDGVSFVRP